MAFFISQEETDFYLWDRQQHEPLAKLGIPVKNFGKKQLPMPSFNFSPDNKFLVVTFHERYPLTKNFLIPDTIAVWKLYDQNHDLNPLLQWVFPPFMECTGALINDKTQLSPENRTLLMQHDAKDLS